MRTSELHKRIEGYHTIVSDLIINAEFTLHGSSVNAPEWIHSLIDVLSNLKKENKKIFFIGNGASCSMASHFAVDFTKNAGINAFSLNEGALLTCFSNDFTYETAYLEMLRRYMTELDCLFAISSSGKSANIVKAAEFVRSLKTKSSIITLSGFSKQNPLRELGTHNLYIKSNEYGYVESVHSYYMHMIIDMFIESSE